MKKKYLSIVAIICFAFSSNITQAQNICMVTADYNNADSYMIIWETFTDMTNLDSVFVYRWTPADPQFIKIGSVDISNEAPTYFTDLNANLLDENRYSISYLDSSGIETARSEYHQPSVLDFDPTNGMISWSTYEKEYSSTPDHIISYELQMDESGLNIWESFSILMNYDNQFTDQAFTDHPNARYELLVSLDNCDFQTKANIHKSRSNIKNQFSNASATIQEQTNPIEFSISPNPANSNLDVVIENKQAATINITTIDGKVVHTSEINNGKTQIDIHNLNDGVYFVILQQDDKKSSQKLIKF